MSLSELRKTLIIKINKISTEGAGKQYYPTPSCNPAQIGLWTKIVRRRRNLEINDLIQTGFSSHQHGLLSSHRLLSGLHVGLSSIIDH